MNARILRLKLARVKQAEQGLDFARQGVKDLFPVNSRVHWLHGSTHLQSGIVDRHGYRDEIFVRNDRTDKVVKVTFFQIEQALEHRP